MPRYKPVTSLYNICVKEISNVIFLYCSHLEENQIEDRGLKITSLNNMMLQTIPASILNDILEYHTNKDSWSDPLKSFYFYKAVLHKNVKKFQAKNHRLTISHWKCLFKSSFTNLKVLNLALSCSDSILQLIPRYCPNLECLNATCKYERMNYGGNATSFSLSVTDIGLGFLCMCRKLRYLTINEPRSHGRGIQNSITYTGLRKLLREVPTLEDITYSDMGSVVSKELSDVESLNIKVIRHFNGTKSTMKEIFRLCKNLEVLYLLYFNFESQQEVIEEIMSASLKLKVLEVQCLHFESKFITFFEKMGPNLVYLSIKNYEEPMSFGSLVTIGRCCPNLKYFSCSRIVNQSEIIVRPTNIQQFTHLQSLFILGHDIDLENVLIFCTENAKNLVNLKIAERCTSSWIDKIFINVINPINIKHIEASPMLLFSKQGIQKIIDKYVNLAYLNVYCPEDCTDIVQEIRRRNYEFTLINKKTVLL